MSDISKKRSRKSKLVPRDCGENEENINMGMEELTKTLLSELETEDRQLDSLPNPLQTVLPKLRTELDKDYDDNAESSTRDLKFSIDVEVEECEDDDVSDNHENKIPQNPEEDDELFDNFRKKKIKKHVWPLFVPEKTYRASIEKLSKITRALADKVLEVHIRNYLGRYVNEVQDEMDYYTRSIHDVLGQFIHWQKLSKFREAILSYKCYVCDIGWWHLGPFHDHIKEHGKEIKISFQPSPREACIVAHVEPLDDVKEIPIEGRCWQCMKTWDEHANLKRNSQPYYRCPSCTFKSPTCSALLEHEGNCLGYHKEYIKEPISYEIKRICPICTVNCITEKRLNTHMALTHFARTDFHCNPVNIKKCSYCGLGFVLHTAHPCRNRSLKDVCNYCMRRFTGKFLADLHMTNTKKNIVCGVCNAFLRSQCMEVEHMIKHSKNYVLVYRCIFCPNYIFFNDEHVMSEHKKKHPDKRYFKNHFFELMIAPRKLFPHLPFNEDDMIGPVKPHILGPKLAPVPKKLFSVTERTAGETETAVDAIRYDVHDVHGHDYLLHPYNNVAEPQTIPSPKKETQHQVADDTQQQLADHMQQQVADDTQHEVADDTQQQVADNTQQQVADDTLAAIASISDVTIKTEIEDYSYYDHQHMDVVYEDIDIKKEEFLDTLSNAYIAAEDVTDNIDDDNISNVIKESKQILTHIKEEKQINELLNHDIVKLEEERKPIKIEAKGNPSDDDFEDDIIVLNTESTDNVIHIDDDDDVLIINSVKDTETIDISDNEMQSKDNDNDPNKTSNYCSENILENEKPVSIKERARNQTSKCPKGGFRAEHKEFENHRNTKCLRNKRQIKESKDTTEPSTYPCSKCEYTFPNLARYFNHLRCHKVPPKTCPQCLEIITKPYQLLAHLKGHIKNMFTKIYVILERDKCITSVRDQVYQCKTCLQVVKQRRFFKHWEGHLKLEKEKEVTVESKVERNESAKVGQLTDKELPAHQLKMIIDLLRNEAPRHDPSSPVHHCALCRRPFTRASYLKIHYVEHLLGDALCKRVVYDTETIACQICSEKFNNNLNYKQHMRNHAHLPVYRCELCARSFSDSSNFAKHKKVHNMDAARCDVCAAKFFKRDALIKHMQIHEHTEPINCEVCPKTFKSPNHYKKHKRLAHSDKPSQFTCNICLMKFDKTKERLDHMWAEHNFRKKKVDCPVCNRSFRKFMDMKNHMKLKHNAALKVSSTRFFNATETERTQSWVRLGNDGAVMEESATQPGKDVGVYAK